MFVYFSYKSYPYAPAATFLSALCSFLSMLLLGGVLAFGGFAYYWPEKRMTFILLALLCLGLGLFCFLFVYRRAIPRLAEKMTVKNLASRADLAYRYCREHPEAYEWLRGINPEFAARYYRDEEGHLCS